MNKAFWVKEENQPNPRRGYIERIETSKCVVVEYDWDANKIDLDVLKPHIGEKIEFYRNGEPGSITKIVEIGLNKEGINTVHLESIDEEVAKDENAV